VYGYHHETLLISYSMAVLAGLVANAMGWVAFARNQVRVDKSFSSTASSTQHTGLLGEPHFKRRGSIPPKSVLEQRLLFRELDRPGGGWGFVVELQEEVPRKTKGRWRSKFVRKRSSGGVRSKKQDSPTG
jgi:hypothetical protein